ncbi:hypothetical protein ACRS8P_01300 [Burkholderia cenocepacia]
MKITALVAVDFAKALELPLSPEHGSPRRWHDAVSSHPSAAAYHHSLDVPDSSSLHQPFNYSRHWSTRQTEQIASTVHLTRLIWA